MMRSVLIMLLVSFIAVVFLVTPCFAKIDPETAVGVYLFEDVKGKEVIDHSGKGHNGMFQGGGGKWEEGKFGSAINVTGGWVRIETTDALHPIDEWTVVVWFNIENVTGHHTMVTKWDEYLFRVDTPAEGGNISCFVKPGGNWEPRAKDGAPRTEEWMHGALVWDNNDNGALKLYIAWCRGRQKFQSG